MIFCPKNLHLIQQDREQPETVDTHLSKVPFDAKFADEELNTTNFSEDPGSDGFVMNSAPLFEVRVENIFTFLFRLAARRSF